MSQFHGLITLMGFKQYACLLTLFFLQGWKDRYFRLADGKLTYYKSEKVHKRGN